MNLRPMLAKEVDFDHLRFPLLASAKLDGIRAIVRDGVVMSRSMKPIPSKYVQQLYGHLEHFDGELIVGEPTSPTCYRDTVSHVMARDKVDYPVRYFLFDHVGSPGEPFRTRAKRLHDNDPRLVIHPQHPVDDLERLFTLEEEHLRQGYEGLILRDPALPYKFGRSTARSGHLLKLKRFVDAEAVVVGFEERMHNGNEATVDALGHTARSSHMANKTGHGDLGALVAIFNGREIRIGTGFTAAERQAIWTNRSSHINRLVKFKHFPIGAKDKPRHPVFLGWRDELDM